MSTPRNTQRPPQVNKPVTPEALNGDTTKLDAEFMRTTFSDKDGQDMTYINLANSAQKAEDRKASIAENLLRAVKCGCTGSTMGVDEYQDFDTAVRKYMKWCRAPKGASKAEASMYKPAPSTWKNAVSIINRAFKFGIDINDHKTIYGANGLNKEIVAHGIAAKSDKTPDAVKEGTKMFNECSPAFSVLILEILALDKSIKTQPDSASLQADAIQLLTDALELSNSMLAPMEDGTGKDLLNEGETIDEALAAVLA